MTAAGSVQTGRTGRAKPALANLPAPIEQQAGTAFRHFGHDPQLLLGAPTPTPLLARDDLDCPVCHRP
jgi:hypothetical protein